MHAFVARVASVHLARIRRLRTAGGGYFGDGRPDFVDALAAWLPEGSLATRAAPHNVIGLFHVGLAATDSRFKNADSGCRRGMVPNGDAEALTLPRPAMRRANRLVAMVGIGRAALTDLRHRAWSGESSNCSAGERTPTS